MTSKNYTIFIFRRDLRVFDNKGLTHALRNFDNILPIFIFTPEQITNKNHYKSDNSIQFMIESLVDLDSQLKKYRSKLHLFYGDNIKILDSIVRKIKIQNIVFNIDYTPYARTRDQAIINWCQNKKINCLTFEGYLLLPIGTIAKSDGNPYSVFTAFRNKAKQYKVDRPVLLYRPSFKPLTRVNIVKNNVNLTKIKYQKNKNVSVHGGRSNVIKILDNIDQFKKYNETRNLPSIQTTRLSAYIKFGCVSIREVYWKIYDVLGSKSGLLTQLWWREFYFYIVFQNPHVLSQSKNLQTKFNDLNWIENKEHFDKWCKGETGYPIVDAGMRELNNTGYMHNRARLITSNFLNRLLGMDWRLGEKYFAQQLVDYDPAVNNGNWQWIASVGVDTSPFYQRVFNPWLQSKKYDPDAIYIKKWIPSLSKIPASELHSWDEHYQNYELKKIKYIVPIVDYKKARERSIKMYQQSL